MKLMFMKSGAVDYFRANLDRLYTYYYVKADGSWINEEYPDAFEEFITIEDFELADPDLYTPGELEVENCKILYLAMKDLSPSQAADERLWAGLCNGVFYDYLKRRWGNYTLGKEKSERVKIEKRFFAHGGRAALFSNSLARWWWIGKITYDPNSEDHWEKLDAIGAMDFSTKVYSLFKSYNFSSNPIVMDGILRALKELSDHKVVLVVKKHLRPALKYLNAYGGSVLLDSLDSEEIKRILLKKLLELRFAEDKTIDYSGNDYTDDPADDEEDVDSLEAETISTEIPKEFHKYLIEIKDSTVRVNYCDRVRVIRQKDSKEMGPYDIPGDKEAVSKANIQMIRELIGRKLDERFLLGLEQYRIVEIIKVPPVTEIWQ